MIFTCGEICSVRWIVVHVLNMGFNMQIKQLQDRVKWNLSLYNRPSQTISMDMSLTSRSMASMLDHESQTKKSKLTFGPTQEISVLIACTQIPLLNTAVGLQA